MNAISVTTMWHRVSMLFAMLVLLSSSSSFLVQASQSSLRSSATNCADGECKNVQSLPIGATYQVSFDFAVIGPYVVKLLITDETRGKLIVEGGYPIRDNLDYQLKPVAEGASEDGSQVTFHVDLSEKMKGIMSKFMVSLSEIQYDVEKDEPSVVVSILYVVTFPLTLKRVS